MQMRQRDVAALDAKYTKELADAKAEKWCSAWWCCRLSSSVAHQSSLSAGPRVKLPAASGVDNAASPWLADTAERDYFTLRERLITMQKQLEGTQKYINEQQIELPISGNSCNYCEQYTRAQRSINA